MLGFAWDFEESVVFCAVDEESLLRMESGLLAPAQTLSTEYFGGLLVEALSLRDCGDVLLAGVIVGVEEEGGEQEAEQQVEEGLHLIQDYRSSAQYGLVLKLISMLIRAKALLPLIRLSNALLPRTAALFGTRKWSRQEFLKKLEKEIIDSQSQIIIEDPHNEAYFKSKGWSIQYKPHKTLFSFSKTTATREAKVLVHVKDDPPNTQEQIQEAETPQQPTQRVNYSQVGIYIRRKGEEKWLTAEMAVMQGSVELMGVFFTHGEPDFSWEKGVYPGPQLKTLPEEVLGVIQWILEETGVSAQVLMNMVILASNKVDELDLQWLKDLREIWS